MICKYLCMLLVCLCSNIIWSQDKAEHIESIIYFIDGDVLRGKVESYVDDKVTIETYGQKLVFDMSEIEKIVNVNGIPFSNDLLLENHVNINLGAHLSFGNDFEYDLSLDYLHRLNDKNFIGISIGLESYFKFIRQIGRIDGRFTSFSAAYEHLYSGTMRNYFTTVKLGYATTSADDRFNQGRSLNGGVHSRIGMGYRFKTAGNVKIGIEGGVAHQYVSGQELNFNGLLTPFNQHLIKPTLRFVISIQ